jgi:hypothetical protein
LKDVVPLMSRVVDAMGRYIQERVDREEPFLPRDEKQ